jgi:transcription elongation factor Elf1
MAIEMKGGVIVRERGTVVTYHQKCGNCGYTYDYEKTTIVPAYSERGARNFTCPECGHYQEVSLRHYKSES